MKQASAALIALLNSTVEYIMADCYEVALFDGTVLRWTDFDLPIVLDGDTYLCAPDAPTIRRSRFREVVGLEIATCSLTLGVGTEGGTLPTIGGVSLPLAADNGAFDEATVIVRRVFMPTPGDTTAGALVRFSGQVSNVEASSTQVALVVKSDLDRLSRVMPRNVIMPACTHVLFDAGCTLDRAAFLETGEIDSLFGSSLTQFYTDLTEADGYFDLGVIIWTSGANTGRRSPVKRYLNALGFIELAVTPSQPVAPGDTFQILPGCDKTRTTCDTKFSNIDHFRGFPFVPAPETAR